MGTDVDAIQRIKAAFNVNIADQLRAKKFTCIPSAGHVDVLQDGYVFRILVAYHMEARLMQFYTTSDGMIKERSTPESNALEYKTLHMPTLSSQLHGLQNKCESFGRTCRLAKKWLGVHMLSNHITEEAVDLLVSYIYTHSNPFPVPRSSSVAFLRFLGLLSSFNFNENPIIVDFHGDIKDKELDAIQKHFDENRSNLPHMCIFTPKETSKSLVTFDKPKKMIVRRIKDLAKDALVSLECAMLTEKSSLDDFKVVFTPFNPKKEYDVVIQWRPEQNTRKYEAAVSTKKRGTSEVKTETSPRIFPVVGYDPVTLYVEELQEKFGEYAMFFYNKYGEGNIGVLWRPDALTSKSFKINKLACMTKRNSEGNTSLNVTAIIKCFEIIGRGFVDSIHVK